MVRDLEVPCTLVTTRATRPGTVRYLAYDAVRVVIRGGGVGVGDSLTLDMIAPGTGARFRVAGEVCRVLRQGPDADYGIRLLVQHKDRQAIGEILERVASPSLLHPPAEKPLNGRVGFV